MEYAEITKEVFYALTGEAHFFAQYQLLGVNFFEYRAYGCRLKLVHNLVNNVTQYFINDINA